ncbi:conserved hypothetical protein [Frankia canadensis]|uniref:Uncharacterized protein n=1 Tax=Frankia canadensis TaxID=1836972 RepID=A0A2I2KQ86_9ACTN|nr:hypothetical protein [Frankia canadensis]SNQ47824.1 conserved hypothetical protein [Frankia canadensis]SOU55114.1 conserved hypothetical protein [Frankia canadensis]
MSGSWDATVKAVRSVHQNTDSVIDVIPLGTAFQVIADVVVGDAITAFGGSRYRLAVTVRNQSQLTILHTHVEPEKDVPPSKVRFEKPVRVDIPGGWAAAEDDVLDVIVSFSLKSGLFTDTTAAVGQSFIVSKDE